MQEFPISDILYIFIFQPQKNYLWRQEIYFLLPTRRWWIKSNRIELWWWDVLLALPLKIKSEKIVATSKKSPSINFWLLSTAVWLEPEMIEIYWHFHKISSNILRNTSISMKKMMMALEHFLCLQRAWHYFLKNPQFSMNFCWCFSAGAVGSPANWELSICSSSDKNHPWLAS